MTESLYFNLLFAKLSDEEGNISSEMLENICKYFNGENIENLKYMYDQWCKYPQLWCFKPNLIKPQTSLIRKNEILQIEDSSKDKKVETKDDPVMIIHVCDEPKNLKRDFSCGKALLLSEMRYFSDYLSENQNSADVDISVHCDVNIFDWLMKYVKRHLSRESSCPSVASLKPNNVISILISSEFLKMDSLVNECINHIHENIDVFLASSCNINCLNPHIINRLADKFTDRQIHEIVDTKDKLKSQLYKKKIEILFDSVLYKKASVIAPATQLFKCEYCGKLLLDKIHMEINCVDSQLCVRSDGTLIYRHQPIKSWTIEEEISDWLKIWKELDWPANEIAGSVYWKLWAHCNVIWCNKCCACIPLVEINQCRFHPDAVHFGKPDSTGVIPIVEGLYTCCGLKSLKFDLFRLNKGCKTKTHEFQLFKSFNINYGDESAQIEKLQYVIDQHSTIFAEAFVKRSDESEVISNYLERDNLIGSNKISDFCSSSPSAVNSSNSNLNNQPKSKLNPSNQIPRLQPLVQCSNKHNQVNTNKQTTLIATSSVGSCLGISSSPSNSSCSSKSRATLSRATSSKTIAEIDEEGDEGESEDLEEDNDLFNVDQEKSIVTIRSGAILIDAPQFPLISNKKWDTTKSMRSNQDSQRQEDLRRTRQIIDYLTSLRKQIDNSNKPKARNFSGGIYCQLENRWRSEILEKQMNNATLQKTLKKPKLPASAQPFK